MHRSEALQQLEALILRLHQKAQAPVILDVREVDLLQAHEHQRMKGHQMIDPDPPLSAASGSMGEAL